MTQHWPRIAALSALIAVFAPGFGPKSAYSQAPAPASSPAPAAASPNSAAAVPASTPPPVPASGPASGPVKLDGRTCLGIDEAAKEPNRDVCITAHVYALVELQDGTRFLDVCPPDLPDAQCRFTLLSRPEDRDEVGDLSKYRDRNIALRGVVRTTHGRMGIVISHVRQFRGGPEKFRPNPKLLRDFNGESDRPAIRDPNLAPSGRHRSFMNSSDREPLPRKP